MGADTYERVLKRLLAEAPNAPAAWITPTGEVVPVPPRSTHDTVAARLMGMEYDPDDWEHPMTPSDIYIDRGGVKVRSYDSPDLVALALRRLDPTTRRLAAVALQGQPPRRRLLLTTTAGGAMGADTTVGDFLREGAARTKSVEERVYERLLREADMGSVQFSPDRTDGVDRG